MGPKTFTIYRYHLTTGADYTASEWSMAASKEAIQRGLFTLNREGSPEKWEAADLEEIRIPENVMGALVGIYLGSRTTFKKSRSSAENGRKGGRPRKEKNLIDRLPEEIPEELPNGKTQYSKP